MKRGTAKLDALRLHFGGDFCSRKHHDNEAMDCLMSFLAGDVDRIIHQTHFRRANDDGDFAAYFHDIDSYPPFPKQ
ncbi:hypothetical protein [Brevundimonas naejangsanensis]|uniref:hypothetical protein n=1 Tax=Brevundimonas naejangsanensis TaxID=588932 RepID=UPI0026EB485A|nr:hypothetical protein [Brevundimonas naejangsanensis]